MSKKFKCLENETMNRVYAKKKEAKRAAELGKNYIMENIERIKCLTSEPIDGTLLWHGINKDGSLSDSIEPIFYNHKNKRHQRLLRQGKLYGEIHYVMNAGKETIEFLF